MSCVLRFTQTTKFSFRKTLATFISIPPLVATDRLTSNHDNKGYCQHTRQHYTVPKINETNGHAFMTHPRLCPVSTQQAIPPRQIKSKIGVSFMLRNGVMRPVHIRWLQQTSAISEKKEIDYF